MQFKKLHQEKTKHKIKNKIKNEGRERFQEYPRLAKHTRSKTVAFELLPARVEGNRIIVYVPDRNTDANHTGI